MLKLMGGRIAEATTLWTDGVWRCVFRRTDDEQLELLLQHQGQIVRFERCETERIAMATAYEWLIAIDGIREH